MGNNLTYLSQQSSSIWQDYEIIDNNQHDQILYLRFKPTDEEYLGKQIVCGTQTQLQKMQRKIDQKMSECNRYLNKVVKVVDCRNYNFCNQQRVFYLLFEKPHLTLREQNINRKFKYSSFSQLQILHIMESAVKGLMFLKKIGQSHQRICSQNIFLRQDRTIMLSDPWLYPLEYTPIYNLQINGYIYPSPEKILFQNDLIERYDQHLSDYYSLGVVLLEIISQEQMDVIYDKGFRKILENKISQILNKIQMKDLKERLRILMMHQPVKRMEIQKYYIEKPTAAQMFIKTERQKFKNCFKGADTKIKFNQRRDTEQRQTIINNVEPINVHLIEVDHNKKKAKYTEKYPNQSAPQILTQSHLFYQPYLPSKVVSRQQIYSRPIITFNRNISQQPQKINPLSSPPIILPISPPSALKKPQQKQVQSVNRQFPQLKMQVSVQNKQSSLSREEMEATVVKNSMESVNHSSIKQNSVNNSQDLSNGQIQEIKTITELNNHIKEVHSLNASEDKSQVISQVIGHGFGSKQSGSFGLNSKPEIHSKQIRASLPQFSGDNSIDLQNYNGKVYGTSRSQSIDTQKPQKKISVKEHQQSNKKQCEQTPEHKPNKKRHNSTIKEVSEQSRSVQSYQIQKEIRVVEYDVGTKYIGQLKNQKRDGKGIFYYKDGSSYEGDWKQNKMHGKGSLYYSNGQLAYEGSWYMDSFHGKGRIYNGNTIAFQSPFDYTNMNKIADIWQVYDGDFFYQRWNGKGKLKLSNGQVFIGDFTEDKVNGQGKFYKMNGEIVYGKWVEGYLVKEFK